MAAAGLNSSPQLHSVQLEKREAAALAAEADPECRDEFDDFEIFDLIRDIKDPEHPHTLEQLHVAQRALVSVDDLGGRICVQFTPTIPHCSMATLIGLCIRVRLIRSLPPRFKVDVRITPGKHEQVAKRPAKSQEAAINKQLNDKERVMAALENDNLLKVVNQCLEGVGD